MNGRNEEDVENRRLECAGVTGIGTVGSFRAPRGV